MTVSSRSRILGLFVLACLLTIAGQGCNRDKHPPRYAVSGKIVFADDEPVRTGVVEFVPADGTLTAHGNIERDGTYSLSTISPLDGAVPGNYKVVVKQFIFYDRIPKHKHDHGGDVSLKYADARSTPLEFVVEKGQNTANFQVDYRLKK